MVRDIARTVFSRLNFVGGAPRAKTAPNIYNPIEFISALIRSLEGEVQNGGRVNIPTYGEPGALIEKSGENGKGGSKDPGIYGAIQFPTDLSASAQTVIFRKGVDCPDSYTNTDVSCVHGNNEIKKSEIGEWRDNFCEVRGNYRLFVCPAGQGHAGQDVWGDWRGKAGMFPLRAAVDGVAFRRFPAQPAVTLSDVNGSNIDYIYRHMRPSVLTDHGILASQATPVTQGCILAMVDQLQSVAEEKTKLMDNGISYDATLPHLHFEIRVPTKSGFQNVSPYSTLVLSHRSQLTGAFKARTTAIPCTQKPNKKVDLLHQPQRVIAKKPISLRK